MLDGIGKSLNPRFDISEIAAPYARGLLLEARPQLARLAETFKKKAGLQNRAVRNLFTGPNMIEVSLPWSAPCSAPASLCFNLPSRQTFKKAELQNRAVRNRSNGPNLFEVSLPWSAPTAACHMAKPFEQKGVLQNCAIRNLCTGLDMIEVQPALDWTTAPA